MSKVMRSLRRQGLHLSSKDRLCVRAHGKQNGAWSKKTKQTQTNPTTYKPIISLEGRKCVFICENNNLTGVAYDDKKTLFKVGLLNLFPLKTCNETTPTFVRLPSITDPTQPEQFSEEEWANIAPSQCINCLKKWCQETTS